jgi:hypothetical protein
MTSKSAQNRMIPGVVTLLLWAKTLALSLCQTLEDDFARIKVVMYRKRYIGVYLTSHIKMVFKKDRINSEYVHFARAASCKNPTLNGIVV